MVSLVVEMEGNGWILGVFIVNVDWVGGLYGREV